MEIPEHLRPGAKRAFKRLITAEDITHFARITGDRGRHHLEPDAAGRVMAHGLLTASLPTKIGGDFHYMARTMEFEFLKAVYSGDELTCTGEVVSCVAQSARFKVRFSFEIVNQRGEAVLRGGTSGQILR